MKKKRLWKKGLAILMSSVMAVGMLPTATWAGEEETTFTTTAYANHWGRSDLRAYLNGVSKVNDTLPVDTTQDISSRSGYVDYFSDAEYALIQPYTYETNVFDTAGTLAYTYETTDKFWLPSGFSGYTAAYTSWGKTDISSGADAVQTQEDISHLIPESYWSRGDSFSTWLRSSFSHTERYALAAAGGFCTVDEIVGDQRGVAAAFQLDISQVTFASAASVSASIDSEAKVITIEGSDKFGEKTSEALPDYGMYLKMKSDESFSVYAINLYCDPGNAELEIIYTGGTDGDYIVVQAYKEDSLTEGTSCYVLTQKLEDSISGGVVTVDISAWNIDDVSSLDGYTVKVWLEEAGQSSGTLAKATKPETFECQYGSINFVADERAAANARVFAMKEDLQTSWGTLTSASDLSGEGATNQKIYYGTDSSGNPLQFWIAGREDPGSGRISEDGEIMTLYQAKSVECRSFNQSMSSYSGDEIVLSYACPSLTAKETVVGSTLEEVYTEADLKELLGVPKGNNLCIAGTWSWKAGATTSTGDVGTQLFDAIFTPSATYSSQFEWDNVDGWDGNVITVSVPITVRVGSNTISSVTITEIDSPAVGTVLDTTAVCETTGMNSTTPSVTWTASGSPESVLTADYNTSYTASVTLTADTFYEFADQVTAAVNGQSSADTDSNVTVVKNSDGTITVSITFPATAKDKLTGITAPQPITVANGTAYEAMNLPTEVAIATEGNTVTSAAVEWDTQKPAEGSYDPSVLTEQTVTLRGTVICPESIDANCVALSAAITITISAADTPEPTPVTYEILDGANSNWVLKSDGSLSVRGSGEFAAFTGVKVDGTLIDAKNYIASAGSTIIKLTADYLDTLSVGSHTMEIMWTDGSASTAFTVSSNKADQNGDADTENDNSGSGSETETGSGNESDSSTKPDNSAADNSSTKPNNRTETDNNAESGSGSETGSETETGTATDSNPSSEDDDNLQSDTEQKDDVPKTGDDAPVVWLFVLAIVSGAGLILTGRKGKKNRNGLEN